jgi:hypothetical protein
VVEQQFAQLFVLRSEEAEKRRQHDDARENITVL